MQKNKLYLGWDVGGTKSAAVVGTSDGQVLDRVSWPSHAERGPKAMLEEFFRHVTPLRRQYSEISAMGVSIGGPLNARDGMILSPPHLPGWDRIPLAELLTRELGLKVKVEHDAAACLLAEHLWGGARGKNYAAYLTCGTGCGAGILIDGRILRGPNGETPEFGHVRLMHEGPEVYGKMGCVESFCSGTGLSKLPQFLFPQRFDGPVSPKQLVELAAAGDEEARHVLMTSATYTGYACAILGDLFSPQVIVLGSLAMYLPEWWLLQVRKAFHSDVLGSNGRSTEILPAELGKGLQDLSSFAPCVVEMKDRPVARLVPLVPQ